MVVVHGVWTGGRLGLWGESGLPDLPGDATELTLSLPTSDGRPVPSTAEIPADAHLAQWPVTARLLDPGDALTFLGSLTGDDLDWTPASDLRYLAVLADYAAGLVRRGRLLPQLVVADGAHAARWRPVLTGRDATAFREFAAALPPAVRSADARPPGETLRSALDALTDAAARRALPERLLLGHRPGPKAPVADRWTRALTADDPTLTVTTAQRPELAQLKTALDEWHRAAHAANDPIRVCFRLVEPLPTTDRWDLEFALQSVDDPSLYVPAELIWAGQRVPGLPARPDETLLAGLGRAVKLFPPLDEALREAQPTESRLDTASAFAFLRQAAPLLQAAGYGVQLPAWAGRKSLGLKLTTRSKAASGKALAAQGVGKDELVDFHFDLMIGEEQLSADDLRDLARLKVPLLRVKGRWVELDERQLTAAIRAVEQHHAGQMTIAEVLGQVAMGGDEELPLVEIDADGWLGDLLAGDADHRLQPTPTPAAFRGTLRPYQERGLSWLDFLSRLGIGGILADDMGLGKCIGPDSTVFLNGTLVTAEDAWKRYSQETRLEDGDGQWSVPAERLVTAALDSDGRMVAAPVARLYRQHVEEKVRRVSLDDGSQILLTERHRLRGVDGWIRDLREGDRMCVPSHLDWHGEPVDHDLVKLLAWQISEGYESRNGTLRITQKDPRVLFELVENAHAVARSFGLRVNKPRVHVAGPCHELRMCSAEYAAFLRTQGYEWGRLSAAKRIPDFIVAADKPSIRLFLREFFSAEGSVGRGMRVVEIASASPWLMAQLVTMLRRFGIWMRTTTKLKGATNGSGVLRPYSIGIIGGPSLRRFQGLVGFADSTKQSKLEAVCGPTANTNVEGVPGSDLLLAARSETRLPQRHFGVGTVYFAGNQEMSRATASAAVAAMDGILSGDAERAYRAMPATKWTAQVCAAYAAVDTEALRELRNRLDARVRQDVFYSRILSVEEIDYSGYVYDFEIAEHHNFVASGMLCHNTAQTLSLLLAEREQDAAVGPTLLICPMSLVSNWRKEAEKFAPALTVYVHHGATRDPEQLDRADLVITTYGTALRDLDALRQREWGRVVCDEAQAIKNAAARQSQAVRAIPARTRLALTGTPVENHLAELWSIMDFANPGLLGPVKTFRRRYQEPIEVRQDADAAAALKRATGPFVLRRLKTDKSIISDLPEKLEMKVWCPLTAEQATLYQAVVDDMLAKIGSSAGIERRGNVLAAMTRLKQVCNHPAHLLRDGSALAGRSGKLARLQELAEEIVAEGDKGLVFTQYAEFGSLLQPYLAAHLDRPVLWLHGGLSKSKRDELVTRFQTDPEPMIFLLSLKAAGTGLNLTAATHVIHVDRWWNPAVEDQATDRAYRIGQSRTVQVRKFVCTGTIEERVDEMIERKKALAQSVVGTGEDWLTELSTDELRELFRLDPKAVG